MISFYVWHYVKCVLINCGIETHSKNAHWISIKINAKNTKQIDWDIYSIGVQSRIGFTCIYSLRNSSQRSSLDHLRKSLQIDFSGFDAYYAYSVGTKRNKYYRKQWNGCQYGVSNAFIQFRSSKSGRLFGILFQALFEFIQFGRVSISSSLISSFHFECFSY